MLHRGSGRVSRGEALLLDPALVADVHRLHATGQYTQRAIARKTGVSRGSVATIVSGRRPDYQALRAAKQAADAEQPPSLNGPRSHCDECGCTVTQPCVACRAKAAQRNGTKRITRSEGTPEGLAPDLKPEDEARRRELRVPVPHPLSLSLCRTPFATRCAACGRELIVREVLGRARCFRREDGEDIEVKTCPGCGKPLGGLALETIQEQTGRTP